MINYRCRHVLGQFKIITIHSLTQGGSIMDMNKILQWMDLAKKYQTTDFWNEIFEKSSFDEFMKNNSNS